MRATRFAGPGILARGRSGGLKVPEYLPGGLRVPAYGGSKLDPLELLAVGPQHVWSLLAMRDSQFLGDEELDHVLERGPVTPASHREVKPRELAALRRPFPCGKRGGLPVDLEVSLRIAGFPALVVERHKHELSSSAA